MSYYHPVHAYSPQPVAPLHQQQLHHYTDQSFALPPHLMPIGVGLEASTYPSSVAGEFASGGFFVHLY